MFLKNTQIRTDRFASMNLLYSHHSLDYFLEDSEKLGYKNIELWGAVPHYSYDSLFQDMQCQEIKAKVAAHNLNIICFTPEQCVYPFNIASPDFWVRVQSIKYFSRCIEDAALLESPMMLVTPGWGNLDQSHDEAWNHSIESMNRLLKKAEKEGVVLAYEILLPTESNLVNDLASLSDMMKNFDSDNMAVCVDTVPMCAAGQTMEQFFEEFGDKIRHVHLNDGTPTGHMAWGDGTQDLKAHLQALADNKYQGYITFETADSRYMFEPGKAFEKNLTAVMPHVQNSVSYDTINCENKPFSDEK